MFIMNLRNYCVIYYPNKVVLQGDSRTIHIAAQKILAQFQLSAKPYSISLDSSHLIELVSRD